MNWRRCFHGAAAKVKKWNVSVERFCANGGVRLHSSDQAHANTLAAHLQTKAIANNPHKHSFDLQVARRLLHSR
jgi:hypothetical protein